MNLHGMGKSGSARRRRNRVGRGMGSGSGKTCGKGHKGQMARKGHKRKIGFEGGQMRLVRRVPKRGFVRSEKTVFAVVNVGDLSVFPDGATVDREALTEKGLMACSRRPVPIKALGFGDVKTRLVVKAQAFSAQARLKIEAAGGACETVEL